MTRIRSVEHAFDEHILSAELRQLFSHALRGLHPKSVFDKGSAKILFVEVISLKGHVQIANNPHKLPVIALWSSDEPDNGDTLRLSVGRSRCEAA
jgi:hypothetical protein